VISLGGCGPVGTGNLVQTVDVVAPEIARLIGISQDTVKTHRKNIRRKLNICNSKINLTTYLRAKIV